MRIAVVTGAAQGLGLATGGKLAEQGYRVLLTGRDRARLDAAAAGLSGAVECETLDVADQASVDRLFATLRRRHGRLDMLVNNAGRIYSDAGGLETPATTLAAAIDNNALGAWRMMQQALPMMAAGGYGRVVNVTSGMGAFDGMGGGFVAYRASKTALNVLTLLASKEAGKGVKVNAVCPGWVRTAMGGAAATRTLEEGAAGIVWAATLPEDGPSGGLFRDGKPLNW